VLAFDEPVWRRVECNGLIESEHEVGGFWVQGENTLSSLSGPEQLGYLEAAPEGVATEVLLASLERVIGPVEPRAVLWRRLGDGPVHARLRVALGARRPDSSRAAARHARAAVLRPAARR
jgi:hypothetical protein